VEAEKTKEGWEEMTFTFAQVKAAYKEYEGKKCFSSLKGGVWTHKMIEKGVVPDPSGCTMAKIRPLKEVMGFPEFLEKHFLRA
jgi:hypothetical protein